MSQTNVNKKINIAIDRKIKDELEKLKIIPAEPYNDVIKRLIEKAGV